MANLDIYDFPVVGVASLSDSDCVLLVRYDASAGKISVADLRSFVNVGEVSAEVGSADDAAGKASKLLSDVDGAFIPVTDSSAVRTSGGRTLHESLVEIVGLLQGDGSVALARKNAFVDLGSFSTWDAANAALDGLMADRTANKYNGRLKFDVAGGNYEVVMFIRAWNSAPQMPVWVQRVSGPLSLSDGVLASGDVYAEYVRYSDSSGTVSAWGSYPDLSGFATAVALSTEVSAREAGDASLRTDLTGVTTTVTEHTGRLNTIADDLATETTARTSADDTLAASVAAALNTALGVGTQTAFETIAKCVTLASSSDISTFCNDLIVDRRASQTNGVYILRLRTGQNVILFQTGNSNSDTPTTSHYREQVVIGNVVRSSQAADPDKGFAFGVLFSGSALNVISRAIHYTGSGTDYEVTQEWTINWGLIS